MPRKPLIRSHVLPYHLFNQVNNREHFPVDPQLSWIIFAKACHQLTVLYRFKIHSFVLMPNHYHMICTSPEVDIGLAMKKFGELVTHEHNFASGRVGHVFRGTYKGCLIRDPNYFAVAYKYVVRNPVKAGLCQRVQQYPFSTLHWIVGESKPEFELAPPVLPEFQFPYEMKTDALLDWANRPFANEDSERIRRGLSRTEFKLPRNRNGRSTPTLLETLRELSASRAA